MQKELARPDIRNAYPIQNLNQVHVGQVLRCTISKKYNINQYVLVLIKSNNYVNGLKLSANKSLRMLPSIEIPKGGTVYIDPFSGFANVHIRDVIETTDLILNQEELCRILATCNNIFLEHYIVRDDTYYVNAPSLTPDQVFMTSLGILPTREVIKTVEKTVYVEKPAADTSNPKPKARKPRQAKTSVTETGETKKSNKITLQPNRLDILNSITCIKSQNLPITEMANRIWEIFDSIITACGGLPIYKVYDFMFNEANEISCYTGNTAIITKEEFIAAAVSPISEISAATKASQYRIARSVKCIINGARFTHTSVDPVSEEVTDRILELRIENPDCGAVSIKNRLVEEGYDVSVASIVKALNIIDGKGPKHQKPEKDNSINFNSFARYKKYNELTRAVTTMSEDTASYVSGAKKFISNDKFFEFFANAYIYKMVYFHDWTHMMLAGNSITVDWLNSVSIDDISEQFDYQNKEFRSYVVNQRNALSSFIYQAKIYAHYATASKEEIAILKEHQDNPEELAKHLYPLCFFFKSTAVGSELNVSKIYTDRIESLIQIPFSKFFEGCKKLESCRTKVNREKLYSAK